MQLPTKSMSIEEREKALIDISWMDDEDGSNTNAGEPLRTKNEIKDIVVQRPTVTIKPEAKIVEIGTVYAVVENTVVVQGHVSGDEQVLDSGSLFVFEDRDILGEVSTDTTCEKLAVSKLIFSDTLDFRNIWSRCQTSVLGSIQRCF